jgi:hypothetical protein
MAMPAAIAAHCASEQGKFWEYNNNLYSVAGDSGPADLTKRAADLGLDGAAFEACVHRRSTRTKIKTNYDDGAALGVTGTPAFFINGRMLVGAQPIDQFREIINDELSRKGVSVPKPEPARTDSPVIANHDAAPFGAAFLFRPSRGFNGDRRQLVPEPPESLDVRKPRERLRKGREHERAGHDDELGSRPRDGHVEPVSRVEKRGGISRKMVGVGRRQRNDDQISFLPLDALNGVDDGERSAHTGGVEPAPDESADEA